VQAREVKNATSGTAGGLQSRKNTWLHEKGTQQPRARAHDKTRNKSCTTQQQKEPQKLAATHSHKKTEEIQREQQRDRMGGQPPDHTYSRSAQVTMGSTTAAAGRPWAMPTE